MNNKTLLKTFVEEVNKKLGPDYAEAKAMFTSDTEVEVASLHGEDNTHHKLLVTDVKDALDITRTSVETGELLHHEVIVLDSADGMPTPYAFMDLQNGFQGDADCDILSILYRIVGIEWKDVQNRTITLCEALDKLEDYRKNPPEPFEAFIKRVLDETISQGPDWDEDDIPDNSDEEDKDA